MAPAAMAVADAVRISDGRRSRLVPAQDVVSAMAADDYCQVRLADGRTLLHGAPLAELIAQAPAVLVRVHRSHAVNLSHVEAVARRPGGGWTILMKDGASTPVGRTYHDVVRPWAAPRSREG